jgi:hypothetical protein
MVAEVVAESPLQAESLPISQVATTFLKLWLHLKLQPQNYYFILFTHFAYF